MTKEVFLEQNEGKIIDFYADWCSPCKVLKPKLESINEDDSDLEVNFVNVGEQAEIGAMFNVRSIPTLLYVKDGETHVITARDVNGIKAQVEEI
ncbi:thioredoxin [Tenacibaculum phage pT24]|uniref:Thioredoxin n=1 Tax=Tenacibaculum phage pT24 TaxID=1880590 RepID=A0A1B4XX21_9CAUD|nr:thioredoxin domain [Tenacibaculum phage pT24]BAV39353.1 thioredoxin [Tenacibaculum phage pT24]